MQSTLIPDRPFSRKSRRGRTPVELDNTSLSTYNLEYQNAATKYEDISISVNSKTGSLMQTIDFGDNS